MPDDPPLILLPGMGADERMFAAQGAEFPQLRVPRWLPPEPCEPLPAYAARMARAVDPGRPCFVGGSSFGGMVAVEMMGHLAAPPPLACFLIGSCRSPAGLTRRFSFGRLAAGLTVLTAGQPARLGCLMRALAGLLPGPRASGLRQLADADPRFMRWAMRAIASWVPTPPAAAGPPVFHIHGAADRILPSRLVRCDLLVPGAGHLLAMTHPRAVNDFLRSRMAAVIADWRHGSNQGNALGS